MSELDTNHPNRRYTLSLTIIPDPFDVVGVGDLVMTGWTIEPVSVAPLAWFHGSGST
jgi:hypothetical protein